MPIIIIKRPTPEEVSARLLNSLKEWAHGYSIRFLDDAAFLDVWGSYVGHIGPIGGLFVETKCESKADRVKRLFAQHCKERRSIAEEVSARDFRAVEAVFKMVAM